MVNASMNLAEILSGAVFTAFHEPPRENWKGRGNSWRAHAFVKEVANQFRALLPCTSHRVFSRDFEYPEQEFGYNEFLYDIAVCEVGKITFGNSNRITFAKKAVWLIESEMSNRAADVIADFSKLVIGAAENKLFIGSKQWKDCLEPCAEACN